MPDVSPLYLFSDSQLLFWKRNSRLFLKSVLNFISASEPQAAYIGASNGDQAEYFDIFRSAMENIGITKCRMILSDFSPRDREFLAGSNIVLLAGGDVVRGWKVFESTGIKEAIFERYRNAAVLIGISAGAVQLGMRPQTPAYAGLTDTFRLVPAIIGVHEEGADWSGLKSALKAGGGFGKAFGIPSGAGLIYHPDHSFEPIRSPVSELAFFDGRLIANILIADASQYTFGTEH